jgi:hypothetical protein
MIDLPALAEVAEQHIGQEVSRRRNFKWAFSFKKLEDFAYEPDPPVRRQTWLEI